MRNLKRIIGYVVASVMVVFSCLMLSACGETATVLTSNMVQLGFTAIDYDGTEKKPTVKIVVDEEVVDSGEYDVKYSNNVDAGTGIVKITAKEDSDIVSGTISVGFQIVKSSMNVSTLDEINSAIENDNYFGANLTDNFTLESGNKLEIPEDFVVNFGNKTLVNDGVIINNGIIKIKNPISGQGLITNNGDIVSEVSNFSELKSAFSYANKVVLVDDIGFPSQTDSDTEFLVCSGAKYSEIILDLNGHKIQRCLNINSKYVVDKLTLTNSSEKMAEVNTVGLNDCALYFRENHAFELNVDNIKFVGDNASIKTNGLCGHEDFNVNIKNCEFVAVGTVGAYLPAKYNYTFTDCLFEGISGYYTKSGNHKLINCKIIATKESYSDPVWNDNGCDETGSALILDSSENYLEPLKVEVKGGKLSSVSGYAIEEFATSKKEIPNLYSDLTITNSPEYSFASGKNALFVPRFVMSDELDELNQNVEKLFEELKNPDLEAGKIFTAEEVEAALVESKLYVEIGTVQDFISVDKITLGNSEFLKTQEIMITFGENNTRTLKCNPFKVQDGKIFVVAPVLLKESNELKFITINGKEFGFSLRRSFRQLSISDVSFDSINNSVQNGEAYNEYDIYVASANLGDDLRISYLGAVQGDMFIGKIIEEDVVVYALMELEDTYISIYPVGVDEEFNDAYSYDNTTIEFSAYVVNKGYTNIKINIDVADAM